RRPAPARTRRQATGAGSVAPPAASDIRHVGDLLPRLGGHRLRVRAHDGTRAPGRSDVTADGELLAPMRRPAPTFPQVFDGARPAGAGTFRLPAWSTTTTTRISNSG